VGVVVVVNEVTEERKKYQENIYFLAKDLLEFTDLTPNFHYKFICKKIMEPRQKEIRLWLIPRGFLKTTILTIAQSIWLQVNNPDIRIAIISSVLANAKDMVTAIGFPYLTNERFRLYFSEWCPRKPMAPETKWTESEIHVPNRGGRPMMEGTFEAFGADSTLTSRHFDHLIVDDLVTRENCTTRDQMDKIRNFWRAIFPLRDNPHVPIDVVGTRWDDGDLYGDLEKDEDVEVVKIPSYYTKGNEKTPTWPERYPIEELMKIKAGKKMGSYLFSCLYQQDPIPQEDAVFKQSYFKYFRLHPSRKFLEREDGVVLPIGNTYMSVDGATEEGKNDYSAIPVGFQDNKENVYLLEIMIAQVDPADLIDVMWEMYSKWNCSKYAIQKAVVEKMLKSFLNRKLRQEKIFMNREELGKNTGQNKEFLIKQMQPWYEGGYVWHNIALKGGEYEEQLIRFPKAIHDDGPDAVQMLFEVLIPSSKMLDKKDYDRNSLEMWKRRLKRAMGNLPSESTHVTINARTY
jgi:predicted phage terminase large subunit-like protein